MVAPIPAVHGETVLPIGSKHAVWMQELVDEVEPERRILQPSGPFTKTLRIVCEPCIGIWLSGMEEAPKPLLLEMFSATFL